MFYAILAVVALVVAIGVVAPAVMGGGDGCQVVVQFGGPATAGPATGGNPAPQASPGPAVPGAPSGCVNYVDIAPALVAVILAGLLLAAAARLGRGPAHWGLPVAIGAGAGIVATLLAAFAAIGISTSDQPQSPPGLGVLLLAAIPIVAALGSAFALWRAHAESEAIRSG